MRDIFLTTFFVASFVFNVLALKNPTLDDYKKVVVDASPGWNGIDQQNFDEYDDDDDSVPLDNGIGLPGTHYAESIDDLYAIGIDPSTVDHNIVEDSILTTVCIHYQYFVKF